MELEKCLICLKNSEVQIVLPDCHHIYCRFCLKLWFERLLIEGQSCLDCPKCKTPMDKMYLSVFLPQNLYEKYLSIPSSPKTICQVCSTENKINECKKTICRTCTVEYDSYTFNFQ